MDEEYGYAVTEKGKFLSKLFHTYKTLGLSQAEFELIIRISTYEKAPSAWRLANDMGLIKTERIKATLSRLDSLGFVRMGTDGQIDFSGLQKALCGIPDESIPPFPACEDDEE